MSERWRRALGALSRLGPDDELLERARLGPSRPDLGPRSSKPAVILVAFAVFAATVGVFAWEVIGPSAGDTRPSVSGYPVPPSSGSYVLLPEEATQLDGFDVEVTALTNLPEGTLVGISTVSATSSGGICCPPVEDGKVTFTTQDGACFAVVGDLPDEPSFDVSITARPDFEPWANWGPGLDDPPQQPEGVLLELGEGFENLGGDQVEPQEDGSKWLVARGSIPWPEPRCAGETIPLFGGPECEADEAQLQGDDLSGAMIEVMGAISQGRMCEFWSMMLPPDVQEQHPWPAFSDDWRAWLSAQDFSDVELGAGWTEGALRWAMVGSVGEFGAGESYVVDVIHGDRAIARLTVTPLRDFCPECGPDVVPFWGVTAWDLDPAVETSPDAAFGWCPAAPFPEAGQAWREESADAAVRFVEAIADDDAAALAEVLDESVPEGTHFPVVAGATPIGFNAAGGMLVRTACGADVDAYTVAVTMDDGTTSASMDFTVYLVLRDDGWKVWAVY